jgi:iron complex outermembrane recepter protein
VVFREVRAPDDVDFMAPPAGYHLLGAAVSIARPLGRHELRVGASCTNLLNVRYRDLLDRFRYYADARGTDVTLWIRYGFNRGKA